MSQPWYREHKWYVSPYNFAKEAVSQFDFPEGKRVFISDSTVREMETQPGVRMKITASDIVELAAKSEEVGVSEFYMHPHLTSFHTTPIAMPEFLKGFEEVGKQGFKFKLVGKGGYPAVSAKGGTTWKELVDAVIGAGAQVVEFTVFLPDEMNLRYYHYQDLQPELSKYESYLLDWLEYVGNRGVERRFGVADAGKCNFGQMMKLINTGIEHGVSSVVFYDATAGLSPDGARHLFKAVRKSLVRDVALIPHMHESIGQATMNAVAAVTAGARGVDTCMNGLEYRTGLARLEEVVCALEMLYGISTGIRLEKLYEYSQLVAKKSGIGVHPMQPITGKEAHLYEFAGMVLAELRDRKEGQRKTFMPYAPEAVGNKARVVWGPNTLGEEGVPILKEKLQMMGIAPTDQLCNKVRSRIEERLKKIRKYPVYISESEVESICRKASGKKT